MSDKWSKRIIVLTLTITGIVVLLVIGAILLLLYLRADMIPNNEEEEKVTRQAEQYMQTTYPKMEYEISYILYDSNEQYGNFDYAAVIKNIETGKTFMVYENISTKQVEDDLSIQEATQFIKQVTPKIISYINNTFGEENKIAVTPSFEIDGIPSINIQLNNKNEEISETNLLSFIDYLQDELLIEDAYVSIQYGDHLWSHEF